MELENERLNRKLWIIFGLLFLLVLFNSGFRVFNRDEIWAIHASWKMVNTGFIYTDFYKHHHPMLTFISAPIMAIFGDNITTLFILRGMALAMVVGMVALTYIMAAKLFDRTTALLSIALLITTRVFIQRAIEVRPDTPQVLFGLLSVFFFLSFYQNRSYRNFILSSASLAISFMFMQKAVILIFFIGSVMTVDFFRKELSIKDLFLYSLVFIATLIPFYTYLLLNASLDNYLLFNWIITMDMPGNSFLPFENIFKTFRRNSLLWIFYFPGLWLILRSKTRDANRIRLVVLSAGLLSIIFIARYPNPHYFMQSIPLISILAAFAITTFFGANPKRLLIIVIIGFSIPALALAKRPLKKPIIKQIENINYVLSITDKTDYIYDPNSVFNFFREDPDFFWYLMGFGTYLSNTLTMKDYNGFDMCESIEKTRPKIVADNEYVLKCSYVKDNYKRSEKYKYMFIRVEDG
ncbi:MAG: glycosyltransferase family 39 protein [Thermodesulfobacteriota bacterium]